MLYAQPRVWSDSPCLLYTYTCCPRFLTCDSLLLSLGSCRNGSLGEAVDGMRAGGGLMLNAWSMQSLEGVWNVCDARL